MPVESRNLILILVHSVFNLADLRIRYICKFHRKSRVISFFFVNGRGKSYHWRVPLENPFLTRHLTRSKFSMTLHAKLAFCLVECGSFTYLSFHTVLESYLYASKSIIYYYLGSNFIEKIIILF